MQTGTPSELKRRIGGHIATFTTETADGLEAIHQAAVSRSLIAHTDQSARTITVSLTDPNQALALAADLAATTVGLSELTINTPTLDDVFFASTGGSPA